MEWPFVSRKEYRRALAERNDADRCFTLAQADNATLRKELDAAVNMDLEVKVRQSLEAKLSKMEVIESEATELVRYLEDGKFPMHTYKKLKEALAGGEEA